MISFVYVDSFIILFMLSMALLLILILTITRYRLYQEKNRFRKDYIALFINANKMIELMVPINKQKQQLINPYSIRIRTETFHSNFETNEDYYESILSTNDLPYYPVRETIFKSHHPIAKFKMITDSKNEHDFLIENEINHV